jgi:hypothetical protein
MIRRQEGKVFLLIRQPDHAHASGEMARRFGNALLAPPTPFDAVILGISAHDCGWEDADRNPVRNARSWPLDIFDGDWEHSMEVWAQSAAIMAERNPYSGLLVSLHVMHLAAHASQSLRDAHHDAVRRTAFLFNRFNQNQVELQEKLRLKLGMRVDHPLRGGLADAGRSSEEDLLRGNFRLLQFLDQISLIACYDNVIFSSLIGLQGRDAAKVIDVRIRRIARGVFQLSPWPFDGEAIELTIPARRIAVRKYASDLELKTALEQANPENISVRFSGTLMK